MSVNGLVFLAIFHSGLTKTLINKVALAKFCTTFIKENFEVML